jgi:microcystin-dependent protein
MGSYFRDFYSPTATQRPTVGDTKFSVINQDHMGWMKCDGRALSKTTYNILYQVVGDAFGSSATMFNLPNAVGRVPGVVGSNTSNMSNWALGDTYGKDTHTLTIGEMPTHTHGSSNAVGGSNGDGYTTSNGAHSHTYTAPDSPGNYGPSLINNAGVTGVTSGVQTGSNGAHSHQIYNTGGSNEHNNMQPTIFMGNMFMFSGKVRPTSSNYYPYTYRAPIF